MFEKTRTCKAIICLKDLARSSGCWSLTSATLATQISVKTINFSPTRNWASRENGAIRHSILRGVSVWRWDWKTQRESFSENIPSEQPKQHRSFAISGWIGTIMEYHKIMIIMTTMIDDNNLDPFLGYPFIINYYNMSYRCNLSLTWMIPGEFLGTSARDWWKVESGERGPRFNRCI